jgi:Flp pilus assembly protein TadG
MRGMTDLFARGSMFWRSRSANVAMIFALSLVPIAIAAGAGLDLARAMVVRARMTQALDAAGLALGSYSVSTPTTSQTQLQAYAQSYFNANYDVDHSFGTPAALTVTYDSTAKTAILSSSVAMPTVLVRLGDLIGCTHCDTVNVGASSKIIWGTTKLWVSLVLDNTLSMLETDSTGTSKISALKTATHQLLTSLQKAAATPGDVQVAIVPFAKDVDLGTGFVSSSVVSWTDWEAAPPSSTPASNVGPGSNCPYSAATSPYGYVCTVSATNGAATLGTKIWANAWSSTTAYSLGAQVSYQTVAYKSLQNSNTNHTPSSSATWWQKQISTNPSICPGIDSGTYNAGKAGHYYNGCYDSVMNSSSCTSNCSYSHTWHVNDHSTWAGCIEDRNQNNDTTVGASGFPAENGAFNYQGYVTNMCPPAVMGNGLSYDWTSLGTQVDAMTPAGTTNQTIGLVWGWQEMTSQTPFNAPALPKDTSRIIILLSDGLNTQDRWYGPHSDFSDDTDVDARMALACTAVKADNVIVYAIYVDLNGTQGNSTTLQNCATDSTKYFDLKTSGDVITTFQAIAHEIVQLRVAL